VRKELEALSCFAMLWCQLDSQSSTVIVIFYCRVSNHSHLFNTWDDFYDW